MPNEGCSANHGTPRLSWERSGNTDGSCSVSHVLTKTQSNGSEHPEIQLNPRVAKTNAMNQADLLSENARIVIDIGGSRSPHGLATSNLAGERSSAQGIDPSGNAEAQRPVLWAMTTDTSQRDLSGRGSGSGWKLPGRFLAQLGIIFGGVFGAFVAEDLRQQREDDQRAEQTYEALLGEVRTFVERAPVVVSDMASKGEQWIEQRAAGDNPPPPFYREPRGEVPPTAIWEATLASGGVVLLDPDLFNELAVFYNRLSSASDRYRRYNDFTERELLPYLSADPTHFYQSDGQLRGLYQSHVDFLDEIRVEIEQLIGDAEAVQGLIVAELGRR